MISVDDALIRVGAAAVPLPVETIPSGAAAGRVLAMPARSVHPLPLFDQSAVDGYALRHADIGLSLPARMPRGIMVAAMGQDSPPVLAPGTAARIFTGGLLPVGADTVVRQELVQSDGDDVVVLEMIGPGADIRRMGEEMPAAADIADAGTLITPGLVGALALAGVTRVDVRRLPRIVVLVTGDEVVPPGAPRRLGQVPDANGPLVAAQLDAWGCPALRVEYVADSESAVRIALARALGEADLVLTTGGVSVGDFDFVPAVSEALGGDRVLWRIAQKPGMPLYAARHGQALLFGLPGNPASVWINLHVYVRHALDLMSGLSPVRRWRYGLAPSDIRREAAKTFWLRAVAETDAQGRMCLSALRGQASHMLGNLARANALVRVPGRHEGPEAEVLRWLSL